MADSTEVESWADVCPERFSPAPSNACDRAGGQARLSENLCFTLIMPPKVCSPRVWSVHRV